MNQAPVIIQQPFLRTIHGNWIKVLWKGIGSIRIAYLDIKGMTRLVKNLPAGQLHYTDAMEHTMIDAGLKAKNDLVETATIPLVEFELLIAK